MHIRIRGTIIASCAVLCLAACTTVGPSPNGLKSEPTSGAPVITVPAPSDSGELTPLSPSPSTSATPTPSVTAPSTTAAPTPSKTAAPPSTTAPPKSTAPTTKAPASTTPPLSSTYDKYTCGNAGSKVLLVFDDYPMSEAGFKLLIDTAKANNIGIGVAPNGEYVKSGRAPVDYARKAGMLVVDHTYDHSYLTKLSASGIKWEITQPYVNSNYVRPPYGAENDLVRSVLAQNGKYDCLWNLDPRDWDGRTPQAAADYIVANARAGSTAVVHMSHLGTQPSLLPYIKKGLAKRGIKMCTPWTKPTTPTMPAVYCD